MAEQSNHDSITKQVTYSHNHDLAPLNDISCELSRRISAEYQHAAPASPHHKIQPCVRSAMSGALEVIGAVGAICNIVDVISKTVSAIAIIQSKWADAEITMISLAVQLTTLKTALTKIQEWLDSDMDVHHQLTMDIDTSVAGCRLLMSKIELLLHGMDKLGEKSLTIQEKAKVVFKGHDLNSVQKLIERQCNALHLLLTACNCNTLLEQKRQLEKPQARKMIKLAKQDSASLVVLRDADSFLTKCTDNLSKLSLVFNFDSEILSSAVYERVFRVSLKQTLRLHQKQTIQIDKDAAETLRLLKERFVSEVSQGRETVILLGHGGSSKNNLMYAGRPRSRSWGESWDMTEAIVEITKILLERLPPLKTAYGSLLISPDLVISNPGYRIHTSGQSWANIKTIWSHVIISPYWLHKGVLSSVDVEHVGLSSGLTLVIATLRTPSKHGMLFAGDKATQALIDTLIHIFCNEYPPIALDITTTDPYFLSSERYTLRSTGHVGTNIPILDLSDTSLSVLAHSKVSVKPVAFFFFVDFGSNFELKELILSAERLRNTTPRMLFDRMPFILIFQETDRLASKDTQLRFFSAQEIIGLRDASMSKRDWSLNTIDRALVILSQDFADALGHRLFYCEAPMYEAQFVWDALLRATVDLARRIDQQILSSQTYAELRKSKWERALDTPHAAPGQKLNISLNVPGLYQTTN